MASGAPDGIGIVSRELNSATNVTVVNWETADAIAGESSASADIRTVPTGSQESFLKLIIYTAEEEAIHLVVVKRASDSYVFAQKTFVGRGEIDLSGITLSAGESLRLTITNNHTSAVYFYGTLHWISKTV